MRLQRRCPLVSDGRGHAGVCVERVRGDVNQPPYGGTYIRVSPLVSYRVAVACVCRAAGRIAEVKTRLSMVVDDWGFCGGGGVVCA